MINSILNLWLFQSFHITFVDWINVYYKIVHHNSDNCSQETSTNICMTCHKFVSFCCKSPLEFSHGNLAHVICMLFINIKLFIIDNYLSKGFPGQLHEALCKCIDMISQSLEVTYSTN